MWLPPLFCDLPEHFIDLYSHMHMVPPFLLYRRRRQHASVGRNQQGRGVVSFVGRFVAAATAFGAAEDDAAFILVDGRRHNQRVRRRRR